MDILGISNVFCETYSLMPLLLYRGEKSKQQRPSAASRPKLVTHLLGKSWEVAKGFLEVESKRDGLLWTQHAADITK